jgi:glutamine synthetase
LSIEELPVSLAESIDCLRSDSEFLNGVFTTDLIEAIIEIGSEGQKMVAARPHPYEFYLYFDS